MIGFNILGQLGQLGNQMFQVASLRGIAANNEYNYCFPIHQNVFTDSLGNKLRIDIQNAFTLQGVDPLNIQFIDQSRPVVDQGTFHFNEELFNDCPDWVSLQGYFQSEKYFLNIESTIRDMFTFRPEILNPCKEMIGTVENPVSLHIRRGDYLTNHKNHNNLSLDYYAKGLDHFEGRNVIIFSDDPDWCKQQELFKDDNRFLVSEGNNHYTDMCLMSLCKSHIIANSSFSWWGAWLSNSRDVVAPSTWFGPNNAHLDTKDLYCKGWTLI